MAHNLAGLRLANLKKVQNGLKGWFRSKDKLFYCRGICVLTERWQNVWLVSDDTLSN